MEKKKMLTRKNVLNVEEKSLKKNFKPPFYQCQTCSKEFKSYQKKTNPKYCNLYCFANRIKSKETIEKMSLAKKGRTPWNKGINMWEGKQHPRGTLGKKIRNRKTISEETRNKLRESHIGKGRGIQRKINFLCLQCNNEFVNNRACKTYQPKFCSKNCAASSQEKKRYCPVCNKKVKYFSKMYCSLKCSSSVTKGKKLSEEFKNKLRGPRLHTRGENAYNYKGNGKERNIDMGRAEYRQWRKSVFERDDYTCQFCKIKGGYLNADHIRPYSLYPELRYDLKNGRTLCIECHKKTDTYMGKIKFYKKEKEMQNVSAMWV